MTELEELLMSARAALSDGNKLIARGYYRRAASVAPERVDIWRNLLQVTDVPADRMRCLERIVELDPDDTEAAAELEQIRQEIAEVEAAEAEAQAIAEAQAAAAAEGGGDSAVSDGALGPPVLLDMRQGITDEMRKRWDADAAAGKPLHCIDHPNRETNLRCNRCGAPVCTNCTVRTPVGLRCKVCVKAQQASFFNARWYDYPIAALIALVLSVPAAVMASMAGYWAAIVLSPIAGGMIGGIVHWATGRRRGRWIWLLVGVCVVVGALAALGASAFAFRSNLISVGIYAAMAAGASMGVLRFGGQRRR
jgi:hypothetical protein